MRTATGNKHTKTKGQPAGKGSTKGGEISSPPEDSKKAKTKSELVEKAIHSIEEKIDAKQLKATLGDFIRLLQIQKELEAEEPREIKVTWVDPSEMESVSDK